MYVLAARKHKRGQLTTTESERVRSERRRTVDDGIGVGEGVLGLELLEGERVGVPHVLGELVHEEAHRALEHVLHARHQPP